MAETVRLVGLLLLLVPAIGRSSPADDEMFKSHYERAQQLYQARRYEDAIAALEAARNLRPDPRLELNLGHGFRRLGRGEEALVHYGRYREQVPNLPPEELAALLEYMALARGLVLPPPAAPSPAAPPPKEVPTAVPKEPLTSQIPVAPLAKVASAALEVRRSPAPLSRAAPPLYRRWWFWSIVGIAAAGIVTGAVLSTQPWDANLPPGAPIHDPKF